MSPLVYVLGNSSAFVNRDVELFGEDTLTFNIGTRIGDEIVYSGQARLDAGPGMDPGEDPADLGALYQIGIQTQLEIGSSAFPVSFETTAGALCLPKTPSAVWSSGSTLVSMMESPDLGERDDLSENLVVDRPPLRRVLLER